MESELQTQEQSLGGRPLKFKSPEALALKIDEYFEQAEFPTVTGLAVYLKTNRDTIAHYRQRDGFSDTIKDALLRCQQALEERTLLGKANPAMAIFSLKNNFGWVDKQEIVQSVDITSDGQALASSADAQAYALYLQRTTQPIIEGEIVE